MANVQYFNIRIPAPRRLAMMRADLARHPVRFPHCPESIKPADWRGIRRWTLKNYAASFGLASPGENVLCSFDADSLPVRSVQFADDVQGAHIDHEGWYSDSEASETVRGIVASLPHGRYIPGYYWSSNGEYVLFTARTFDDLTECARDADHEAEKYAETCRDDSERFDRMTRAESDLEDALRDLADTRALRRMGRRDTEDVRECIGAVRQAREELTESTTNYERGGK